MNAKDEPLFAGRSAEDVQGDFFLRLLPGAPRHGRYLIRTYGLNAAAGTVVLFQYDNRVIATAVFDRRERFDPPQGDYHGALYFDPASIRVFEPVGAEVLREVWPGEFTGFSRIKQSLSPAKYPAFERRLVDVELPQLSGS
jgi:hypothetical protein